jgi:magnesium-transporting ATPase (P-type)
LTTGEEQNFDHLDKERSDATIAELKACDDMVESMARRGLRTLCYARKEIPEW